jgi:hypothetical protein
MRFRNSVLVAGLWWWIFAVPGAAGAAEPLATAETNWPGIHIDVTSVVRKGSVLTVKWVVRNEGDAQEQARFDLRRGGNTYVVDEESGTKYYVLTDEQNYTLSHRQGLYSLRPEPGQSIRQWMKLPAPPPEIKAVMIIFNETEPLEGVPITDQ